MSTEPHTPVRVGLADDDGLVRTALTAILSDEAGIELVWAADNGLAAVDHVAASVHDPSRTVDVVLLDVQMPGIDGLEACRRIRALGQPVAVLMLTTFDPDAYLAEALASGADGFITKDEAAPRLGHVVRAAGAGAGVFSPSASNRLRDPRGVIATRTMDPDGTPLTPREMEILKLVAQSMTNQQIARKLHLAEATVKTHVSAIISKLGCIDRVGIVTWAFRQHVIE